MQGASLIMDTVYYLFLLILVTGTCCLGAQEPMIHQCINDKVQPSMEDMLHVSDELLLVNKKSKKHKRATTEQNSLRLHTVYHSSTTDKSFFTSSDGAFQKATRFFSNAFLVEPKEDKFLLQPRCKKTIKSGVNAGKCKKVDKKAVTSSCGLFNVPDYLKGSGVECKEKANSCKTKGPSGDGVNADFILFAGAVDSQCDIYGPNVLAFASVCGIDDEHNRPALGYINICYKNILNAYNSLDNNIVYNILLHELGHAFGFTSTVMRSYFRNQNGNYYDPVSEFKFNGGIILGLTSPNVLKYAREYYQCPSLQYVPLENGGGSGSASSHWESRVLYHELLTPFLSPDYMVVSNFTWAFFEDSGWYSVNYSYTNTVESLELKWGKGLGCDFVTKHCTDNAAFPYSCETNQIGCTFDRVAKGNCRSYSQFFDGCQIILPTIRGACIHSGSQTSSINEIFGATSRCYEHRSKDDIDTSASLACLNTSVIRHPNSGLTAYKIESTSNSVWCQEGEHKVIDGRFVYCPAIEDVTTQYNNIHNIGTLPSEFCHSDCRVCLKPDDSSQCISCQSGLQLNGPAPNSCCDSTQLGDCGSLQTPTTCTNGDLRLVDGTSQYNGNVEICSNSQWGSVCHNNWHTLEAIVVCKQLGFSLIGAKSYCCSQFVKQSTMAPFVMDRVGCNGIQDTLTQCPSDNSTLDECNEASIAGVKCTEPCENGESKIISYYGTQLASKGRVTACHESTFKPVCDDQWNEETASLYCKSLGLSPYGILITKGYRLHSSIVNSADTISITNCGGKDQLADCQIERATDCPNSIAGVICQPARVVVSDCNHGDLRLLGGETNNEGRLEVCINRVWGTVCGYSWDNRDAAVACRQLGYSKGVAVGGTPFGKNSEITLLNFLKCLGSEENLIDCSNSHYSSCRRPASVRCEL